ncbi:glycosyltransferase family 2 protein [Kozakia baliensis]|uniref:glycosyltransferase family 2 protein n=1 Tax=Kozakia baliensis TaxID=153496 RepID=UPI000ADBCCBD|nr:glycosyltransferase family 2 protein [Kozakia baliensis]
MLPYRLDIVIPCFNEGETIPVTIPHIIVYLDELKVDPALSLAHWRLILVDDGSQDGTWKYITSICAPSRICGVKLSRNFGHQSAMLAGLTHADADVVITMDSDLQDDIRALRDMLVAYESGADLALGVRSARLTDTTFKRETARGYYRLLSLMGVSIIEDHADYRLMSARALRALLAHGEVNLFIRGLIPSLGFTVSIIPYARRAREIGESKYTLRKMLGLAIDGITSFSVMPLRLIALLGVLVFVGRRSGSRSGGAAIFRAIYYTGLGIHAFAVAGTWRNSASVAGGDRRIYW